ncbi:MAG: hypothetical protein IPM94_14605 [bacterium]|nr:hypothetical protein [bacterium]
MAGGAAAPAGPAAGGQRFQVGDGDDPPALGSTEPERELRLERSQRDPRGLQLVGDELAFDPDPRAFERAGLARLHAPVHGGREVRHLPVQLPDHSDPGLVVDEAPELRAQFQQRVAPDRLALGRGDRQLGRRRRDPRRPLRQPVQRQRERQIPLAAVRLARQFAAAAHHAFQDRIGQRAGDADRAQRRRDALRAFGQQRVRVDQSGDPVPGDLDHRGLGISRGRPGRRDGGDGSRTTPAVRTDLRKICMSTHLPVGNGQAWPFRRTGAHRSRGRTDTSTVQR